MGCGGIKTKKRLSGEDICDQDLYNEAYKDLAKQHKGLKIDENNSIQTFKLINKNNQMFREEIVDHADESGSVKPWIANIIAPEQEIIEQKINPPYNLKLEHIFGFRSHDVRQNLFFVNRDTICYMNGACGIVQNINNLSQKIFGGLECNDKGDCHNDDIVSIAFYRGKINMIATGQRHLKPTIMIWSPEDPNLIFATFYQTRNTKEVSNLEFDNNGEYIASVGKDPDHTFFVYNIINKSNYWKGTTGPNYIFDLQFNPLGNEFCIVGVKTVLFLFLQNKNKIDGLSLNKKYADCTFTAICYTKMAICLTTIIDGKILIWERSQVLKEIQISETILYTLTYSNYTDKIYISDSDKSVYICNFTQGNFNFKILDKFTTNSVVRAIDVNEDGVFVLGMRNGTILIKDVKDLYSKNDKIITHSHFDGIVKGLTNVNENLILTSGEDNQILLWNLKTKQCVEIGIINEVSDEIKDDEESLNVKNTEFPPSQCSQTVSYNHKTDHVAVGINNGFVSIRRGIGKLNERLIRDVCISSKEIVFVKYSPDMKYLGVSSVNMQFYILDVDNNYKLFRKLNGHDAYIENFDWDVTSRFLQVVTNDNNFLFFDINADYKIEDPMLMRNVNWASFSCKFGYPVQGIFMGSTNPNFVNCVASSYDKKIIVSGDDDNFINLLNYPCICDNHKWKSYYGHSDQISNVIFNSDFTKIISVANQDKSVIIWSISKADTPINNI